MYFFTPSEITVTFGPFDGNVRLIVSALDRNVNPETPIVNITAHPKETVEFTIPSRGFYQVLLYRGPGNSTSIDLTIREEGIPYDLLQAGLGVMVTSISILLVSELRSKRSARRNAGT